MGAIRSGRSGRAPPSSVAEAMKLRSRGEVNMAPPGAPDAHGESETPVLGASFTPTVATMSAIVRHLVASSSRIEIPQ